MKNGIEIEINEAEEITPLYSYDEYPHGVRVVDVEPYWADSEIREAVAELNEISAELVTVTRL